jgi:hypothetical protein
MRLWLKALLLCCLPIVFAGLGYLYLKVLWRPPLIGHSCPPGAGAASCVFHPIIVSGETWAVFGALVGLWVAYVTSRMLFASARAAPSVPEVLVGIPAVAAVVWWTIRDGQLEAGTSGIRRTSSPSSAYSSPLAWRCLCVSGEQSPLDPPTASWRANPDPRCAHCARRERARTAGAPEGAGPAVRAVQP